MDHRTEQVPQRGVLIKTPPKGAGFESGALGLLFSGRDEKVYRIDGVDGGEMDVTGLKSANLAKLDDQFAISEIQIKARLPDPIVEVDIRK
ncbi:hypothetical protein AVEN_214314-1 [Araneus ventricosus]|uniref:Uncharacterized protein n=1 Tax=Araneus ventricosus TaxID=182803 RepID=A0A4Y2L903_ARAVE|nr:hypothetical protein AVEN_214314-1 [Araneus ventricosus]